MADISKLKVNETTYNIKDSTARSELETKVEEAPFDGAEYVRKNGSWALSSGAEGAGATSAIYFYNQTVNVASNAEILRITDSSITPYIVVLECTFANPSYITSDVTWTSYDGYISFTGTCTAATTANVTLGILADGKVNKSGDTMTGHLGISNSKMLYFTSSTTNGLQTARMYLRPFGENQGNNLSIWYVAPTSDPHGAQLYQLPDYDTSLNAGSSYYFKILTDKGTTILRNDTQLVSPHISSTYWSGRDNAPFVVNGNTGNNNYYPALSIKAKTSSWEIGTNGENEYLQFTNMSDANYSTSTNTITGYFRISPNGRINQDSLWLENSGEIAFKINRTDITLGTAPSSDSWIGGLSIYTNNQNIGYVSSRYTTSRNMELRILSRNKTNGAGSNIDNYIGLGVNNNGTKYVDLSDPQAWLTELGLSDSGWQSLTNNTKFSGTIYYRKVGSVIYVYGGAINLASNLSANGYITLGTLPSGYKPSKDIILSGFINSSLVNNKPIALRIITTGDIYLYSNNEAITTSYNIYLCGTGI